MPGRVGGERQTQSSAGGVAQGRHPLHAASSFDSSAPRPLLGGIGGIGASAARSIRKSHDLAGLVGASGSAGPAEAQQLSKVVKQLLDVVKLVGSSSQAGASGDTAKVLESLVELLKQRVDAGAGAGASASGAAPTVPGASGADLPALGGTYPNTSFNSGGVHSVPVSLYKRFEDQNNGWEVQGTAGQSLYLSSAAHNGESPGNLMTIFAVDLDTGKKITIGPNVEAASAHFDFTADGTTTRPHCFGLQAGHRYFIGGYLDTPSKDFVLQVH
jgi:hypothetical protein